MEVLDTVVFVMLKLLIVVGITVVMILLVAVAYQALEDIFPSKRKGP